MKLLKYFLLVLVVSSSLYAQGGSVYSRFGIGELYFNSSAKRVAVGELGTSLFDDSYITSWNPASWSGVKYTRFGISTSYNGVEVSGNSGNSYYSQFEFKGFSFAVPLSVKNGIAVSGGLAPYSQSQYEITESEDTLSGYSFAYQGSGSLSKLYLGTSYKLPFDVNLGLTLNYYLGNFNYYSKLNYSGGSSYSNSEFKDNLKMRGWGVTLGLISPDISKAFEKSSISDLRLGIMADLPATLTGDSVLTASGSIESEAVNIEGFDVNIPMRFAAGLSFVYDNNYEFVFDYLFQKWSEYKFNGYHDPHITDLQKFSFGVAAVKPEGVRASFWEHINLRGGLSYEMMQYDISGERLKELSIFGGFSVPLGRENSIDISLQYGTRGKVADNLLQEKIFRLGATLSFAELWFLTGR